MIQEDVTHTERRTTHAPWSPAQFVALAIGLLFTVLGGVALARTGIDSNNMYEMTSVAGLAVTTLMGIIMLVFGLAMLAVGAIPGANRSGMITLGIAALGLGIIVAIQPSNFSEELGLTRNGAWLLIVSGAVSVLAAMLAPTFWGAGDRHQVQQVDSVNSIDRR